MYTKNILSILFYDAPNDWGIGKSKTGAVHIFGKRFTIVKLIEYNDKDIRFDKNNIVHWQWRKNE